MEKEKNSLKCSEKVFCEIPFKLPSCNEYINACRKNKYVGAKMKAETDELIGYYLKDLPTFEKPVKIIFNWYEGNNRRDLDGIAFSKKFILDAMVKCGKLQDDNRKCVYAFEDRFYQDKDYRVILEIIPQE